MWKQPWGYREGWTICAGIFFTGIFLQWLFGEIVPELFRFPVHLIAGALFLLCLLLLHFLSVKIKLMQWFGGNRAAITALVSLLSMIIFMGFTNARVMVSWPFVLLSFYFLSILGFVILRRLGCFRWKDSGFILNHAGLFIAFFAGLLGSSDIQRLRISVPVDETEWRATNEKNEMVELPLAIELKSFTIDEYPPKLMLLDNVTGAALPAKKPQNVSIESFPLFTRLLDWELEVVNWLPGAAVIANADTVNCVAYHWEGATSALYVKAINMMDGTQKEGWVSCGNYRFQYVALRLNEQVSLIMPNIEPRCFTSDVTVYTQSGITKDALIEVNKPLSVDGWKIYQLSYDIAMGKWSRYSVFELVKDPWLPVVYLGIIMMLAGALFLFISAIRWRHKWIISIISFVFIGVYLLHPVINNKTLMPALQSPWFLPHVIVYMLAYSLLGIAAINALYLLIKPNTTEKQIAIIATCDNIVYVGTAFLTMGMLIGAIWAKTAWGHYWSWDPKETWAAATWISYLLYIHFRLHHPAERKTALYIVLAAFVVLQICWLGVNYLPSAQGNSIHVYN